jgi:2-dehydropantoate 2-reductase
MASVAVIGAGAIGGYAAAAASRNGVEVLLCVRSPLPSLVVESAAGRYLPEVRIVDRPEDAGVADCVLLTTKAHDSAGAAGWFARLCGPDTIVVVMQNGVDHVERIQPLVPGCAVLPALVHMIIDRVAPGHLVHRTGRRMVVPAGRAAAAVAALLDGELLAVEPVEDFLTASWRKLLLNSAANPITALTGRRLGVLDLPEIRELAAGLLREAVAAGAACGARLTERDVTATLDAYAALGPTIGTSMLADRLAGRPVEADLITAAVVGAAERHGLAVPLNRAVLALLHGVDAATGPVEGDRRVLAAARG